MVFFVQGENQVQGIKSRTGISFQFSVWFGVLAVIVVDAL